MKSKVIFFLSLLISTFLFSQVEKYKAYSLSSNYKEGTTWSEWSSFEDVDILASINLDDKKIKIYSSETQIYDIITFEPKKVDEDGDFIYKMYCEDSNGNNCYVDLYILNSQDSRLQIYIRYADMQWVYNLHRIN